VLVLKEGCDVRNVTTIVGLRAYAAQSNILPEQTLGRGLRRMYPGTDAKAPIIIEVDHENTHKDIDSLDIEIPVLRDMIDSCGRDRKRTSLSGKVLSPNKTRQEENVREEEYHRDPNRGNARNHGNVGVYHA